MLLGMETATEPTNPHRQGRPRRTQHERDVLKLKALYRAGGRKRAASGSLRALAREEAKAGGRYAAIAKRWLANKGTR
jgi:hypothetical protein